MALETLALEPLALEPLSHTPRRLRASLGGGAGERPGGSVRGRPGPGDAAPTGQERLPRPSLILRRADTP